MVAWPSGYGVGLFGSGTSWVFVAIHDFSGTGALVAMFLTTLFVSVLALFFAVPFGLYRRITGPRFAFLSFAGMWVVSEWLRTWMLTGFPWLLLGTSQIDSPLAPWAPVDRSIPIARPMDNPGWQAHPGGIAARES